MAKNTTGVQIKQKNNNNYLIYFIKLDKTAVEITIIKIIIKNKLQL